MSFFRKIGDFFQNAVQPPNYLKDASPKSLARDLKRSTNPRSAIKGISPQLWFGTGTTGALVAPRRTDALLGSNPTQADFLRGSSYASVALAGYAYSPGVAAGRAASASGGSGVFAPGAMQGGVFGGANSGGGLFGSKGAAGSIFGDSAVADPALKVGFMERLTAAGKNPAGGAAAAYAWLREKVPILPDPDGSPRGREPDTYTFAPAPSSFFFSAQDVSQGAGPGDEGGILSGLLDGIARMIASFLNFLGGR